MDTLLDLLTVIVISGILLLFILAMVGCIASIFSPPKGKKCIYCNGTGRVEDEHK